MLSSLYLGTGKKEQELVQLSSTRRSHIFQPVFVLPTGWDFGICLVRCFQASAPVLHSVGLSSWDQGPAKLCLNAAASTVKLPFRETQTASLPHPQPARATEETPSREVQ